MLGATIVGSFTLSVVLTSSNASSAFFSPFTRAWELALGGLIALFGESLRGLPRPMAAWLSWFGLGGILSAALVYSSTSSYPGWLVAVPVIGAGLVIAGGAAQPTWGVESVLGLRPFQWLGVVSYSFYLWHWPILIIATQDRGTSQLPVVDNILLVLASLVLAIGTYFVVENPVRHSTVLRGRRWASIAMGGCLIVGTLAFTTAEVQRTKQGVSSNIAAAVPGSVCHPQYGNEEAQLHSDMKSGEFPTDVHPPARPIQMVVVGDSTSCTMVAGLAAVGRLYRVRVADGTVLGCGVVSGQIPPYYYAGNNLEALTKNCQSEADRSEAAAISQGAPDVILWGSQDEAFSVENGNQVLVAGTPAWRTVMLKRMNDRVGQFLATGAKVILLLEPPAVGETTQQDADVERMNGMLKEVAAAHPGRVATIDLAARVCPSGPPCPYFVAGIGQGKPYGYGVRGDGEHYGVEGGIYVAEWMLPQIVAIETGRS